MSAVALLAQQPHGRRASRRSRRSPATSAAAARTTGSCARCMRAAAAERLSMSDRSIARRSPRRALPRSRRRARRRLLRSTGRPAGARPQPPAADALPRQAARSDAGRLLPRHPRRRHGDRLLGQGRSRHRARASRCGRWSARSSASRVERIELIEGDTALTPEPGRRRRAAPASCAAACSSARPRRPRARRCSRWRPQRLGSAGRRTSTLADGVVRAKAGGAGVTFADLVGDQPASTSSSIPKAPLKRPDALHARRQVAAAARHAGQVHRPPRLRARLCRCPACCTAA